MMTTEEAPTIEVKTHWLTQLRTMIRTIKSKIRFWWNNVQFPVARHDELPPAQRWSKAHERAAFFALLLACAAVLLPNLSYPLIEPDETRYAQIAFEMNESGDWITPTLDGVPYLDKPPLMYWLTATSFVLLGDNEMAARLPSVLAALGTILATFLLGRRLVGSLAAWCGAIGLLLCGGFVLASRFLILDSLLACCTTVCLLTGYLAVREPHHRWAWWMASGIACALGVLTKGPVALVICAPPLITSGWLRHDQTRIRLLHWLAFVIPMIVVCVPWYVAVWKLNSEFGDHFFWEHNFKRFTQGSNHQQPFWFYVPVLFAGMFPASLLLPSLVVFLVSRSERNRQFRSKDMGFLFCGAVWIVMFFSLASCKLPTYILPALPLICLMLGGMLDHTVFKPDIPGKISAYLKPFPQRASLIMLFSCLLVVAADVWFHGSFDVLPIVASVFCVVLAAITLSAWNREIAFSTWGWGFTTCLAIGILAFTAGRLLPTIATARSVHLRTATLSQQHPGVSVVYFGEKLHAIKLHMPDGNTVYFAKEQLDEFAAFIASNPEAIVVTDDDYMKKTCDIVSQTHVLISSTDDGHLYLARANEQSETQTAPTSSR